MSDKAEFTITGTLTRAKVAPSGKAVFLTIETKEHTKKGERTNKFDLVAFDQTAADFGTGERVIATGRPEMQKLRDTKRQGSNGQMYDVWAPSLVCVSLRPENSPPTRAGAAPGASREEPHAWAGDDDIPW